MRMKYIHVSDPIEADAQNERCTIDGFQLLLQTQLSCNENLNL